VKIKLENIGMLENADVKLDGLTVIAGENDTGKSTVGKALYFLKYRASKEEDADGKLFKKVFRTTNDKFLTFGKINGNMSLFDNDDNAIISYSISNTKRRKATINERLSDVIFYIEAPLTLSLGRYILESESLRSSEGYETILPFYIYDLIFRLFREDLGSDDDELNIPMKDLVDKIGNTIDGSLFFDIKSNDFVFVKHSNPDIKIPMICTASGVKMFGLLQILISNGSFKENSVLILDEPEVHLHPAWQLKYAELIIALAKHGIFVIVNSHSPYMIEALKVYSDKEGISDKTNFYLAEKAEYDLMSTIKDVTHDLEPIFKKLADPFDTIEKTQIDSIEW